MTKLYFYRGLGRKRDSGNQSGPNGPKCWNPPTAMPTVKRKDSVLFVTTNKDNRLKIRGL